MGAELKQDVENVAQFKDPQEPETTGRGVILQPSQWAAARTCRKDRNMLNNVNERLQPQTES